MAPILSLVRAHPRHPILLLDSPQTPCKFAPKPVCYLLPAYQRAIARPFALVMCRQPPLWPMLAPTWWRFVPVLRIWALPHRGFQPVGSRSSWRSDTAKPLLLAPRPGAQCPAPLIHSPGLVHGGGWLCCGYQQRTVLRCHDPLARDLDGGGIETTSTRDGATMLFDHDADGVKNTAHRTWQSMISIWHRPTIQRKHVPCHAREG